MSRRNEGTAFLMIEPVFRILMDMTGLIVKGWKRHYHKNDASYEFTIQPSRIPGDGIWCRSAQVTSHSGIYIRS
jgi:hypothetical protein